MIYVGSLHYSPIYKSHCCAQGKQLEKKGYNVKYLFNSHYKWMLSDEIKEKSIFIGNSRDIKSIISDLLNFRKFNNIEDLFLNDKPDYVYLHNFHPFLNSYIAKITKKYGGKFIQHVHEPYVEQKSMYGGIHRYWLYLFEYLQQKLLEKTDIAIVSSKEASRLFSKRYSNFSGKKLQIPLMYEDLGDSFEKNMDDRIYISFIGPPTPAKGPERLLKVVEYSDEHEINLRFLLITRAPVNKDKYNYKNLDVFYKNKISDEEIGNFQKKSIMIFTPYKTARQSSVVLTSNMYGTPALATNIKGLNEFIRHEETGYLLDKNAETAEWVEGMDFLKYNISTISKNCRNYFVRNFSEVNWPKYFNEVFNA